MNADDLIQSEIVPRDQLTSASAEEMFHLLAAHFEGVSRAQFERDLAEKNRVILLTRDKELVGFSTLLAYPTWFEGETLNVIYSGDTIVAPAAWGSTALPRAWVTAVEELRAGRPAARCFWLLLTSGFRTYRFLPVFWREFFPRFDCPMSPAARRLLNQLARERFGEQFDEADGLVRFRNPQRLRDGLEKVSAARATNRHVAFFLAQNPGHANGDELVCLTELCPENLTAAGRRMMPAARAVGEVADI